MLGSLCQAQLREQFRQGAFFSGISERSGPGLGELVFFGSLFLSVLLSLNLFFVSLPLSSFLCPLALPVFLPAILSVFIPSPNFLLLLITYGI